jgi:hypothetical protein
MSVDFKSYLLYGHKLGDAKIDERIRMILDEEVGSIGGINLDDLMDDWCFITEDEVYIATVIAKAYPDEFVKVVNLSKALEKADCKLQELYTKIGDSDYFETSVDKLILFSDLGY